MTLKLFLDDERFPVSDDWIIVRSVQQAINFVLEHGFPSFVSFDNDLGENQPEGWRFAQWLIDKDLDTNELPPDFDFFVHSQNSVRALDITSRLNRYLTYKRESKNTCQKK